MMEKYQSIPAPDRAANQATKRKPRVNRGKDWYLEVLLSIGSLPINDIAYES